jgi:hypothetical protein
VPGIGATPRRSVVAEGIRDLQLGTGHGERKEGNPTVDVLDRLARTLDVPLSELFRQPRRGAVPPPPFAVVAGRNDRGASPGHPMCKEATGRPSYHPSVPLKHHICGYLNRVQSSRRLEREAGRNVEVMWLAGRLVLDHKTIADFRKENGPAIREVCAQYFVSGMDMSNITLDTEQFETIEEALKRACAIEQTGSLVNYFRMPILHL